MEELGLTASDLGGDNDQSIVQLEVLPYLCYVLQVRLIRHL